MRSTCKGLNHCGVQHISSHWNLHKKHIALLFVRGVELLFCCCFWLTASQTCFAIKHELGALSREVDELHFLRSTYFFPFSRQTYDQHVASPSICGCVSTHTYQHMLNPLSLPHRRRACRLCDVAFLPPLHESYEISIWAKDAGVAAVMYVATKQRMQIKPKCC